MKKLDNDYEISVDNMKNMTTEQESDNFKLIESEFYSKYNKKVSMNILVQRPNCSIPYSDYDVYQQIFSMKDGTFILEVETEEFIEYYLANELTEFNSY